MALITFSWILDFMLFIISVIIGAYFYMTRNFLYWKKRGVMEIPPTPFTGNFTDFLMSKKSPGELIKEFYNQSANLPYMGFYVLDRPYFLVRDPELIKCVVTRDFHYFNDRFATCHDSLSSAQMFFVNNPGWKLLRTKLTSTYTAGKLRKMFELMLGVGENLKAYLNSLDLKDARVIELKEFTAGYTIDVIGATAFGIDANCLNNPEAEFRKLGSQLFKFNFWRGLEVSSLFFAPQFVHPLRLRFFTKAYSKFMRRVFWDTVEERERSGVMRMDLIQRLMELRKSEADSPDKKIFEFDGDNLVAQAAVFFAAGFESVSSSVSFTLYELALSPQSQTRLREEIKDALERNNGVITYDLILSLPYLDMVVSEALRKNPPLPFLDRVTNADYKVPNSDLVLEKGTPVYIPMVGLHYDPEYFPDPEVFDPERFNEENKRNRKPCVYMPFGEGPRSCIAMRFGLLETKLALIHIISEYEVSPCEKTLIPMKLNPKALIASPEGGLYLNIRKINNTEY